MRATYFVLFAGLACAFAAPPTETKDKVVSDVKQAFAPVAKEVRALLDNTEKVADSLSQKAVKAGERLMNSVRSVFETAQKSDRANLGENLKDRMAGVQDDVKANVRAVLEEAQKEAAPLQANVRSIMFSSRSAIEALTNRYLTDDGKALMKSLISMAGMMGN